MTRLSHKSIALIALGLLLITATPLFAIYGQPMWRPIYVAITGGRTLEQAIEQYGPEAEARLTRRFEDAGYAGYPPPSITLIAYKEEKVLKLWANPEKGTPRLIHTYPVLAASDTAGPKLREGDRQVPEGLYKIESLNPNSSYHLSMKLNYPNRFDRARIKEDSSRNLEDSGGNIFIHGKSASVGCLAMGDPAIEELFVLAHRVGLDHINVIIAPHDPGQRPLQPPADAPAWTAELYEAIDSAWKPYAEVEPSP